VTIGVGFKCVDGIVLCSDTQITFQGSHKFHQNKICEIELPSAGGWACFTFAGDPDLMMMFKDRLVDSMGKADYIPTGHNTRKLIETTLARMKNVIMPNPYGLFTLFGLSIGSDLQLIKTSKITVNEVPLYDYVGVGDSSIVRYLESLFLSGPFHLTIKTAAVIATYFVAKAKAFVDGCGGDTNLIELLPGGSLRECSTMTPTMEQDVLMAEFFLKQFFFDVMNSNASEQQREAALKRFTDRIRDIVQ